MDKLLTKSDVKEFCEYLASKHEEWFYQASVFKNKSLKHSEIWISPSWVHHLAAEPSVMVFNKSVNKVMREAFKDLSPERWTARMLILSPDAHNNVMDYRKLVRNLKDVEEYIADFFNRGLDIIRKYFSSPDEKTFLASYPIEGEFPAPRTDFGYEGVGNCLARAVILDFDYVERFIINDFPMTEFRPMYIPYRECERMVANLARAG